MCLKVLGRWLIHEHPTRGKHSSKNWFEFISTYYRCLSSHWLQTIYQQYHTYITFYSWTFLRDCAWKMPVNAIVFSLNDFLWIQWIMTKSKSSMVTRSIINLATNTLPVLVIQSIFSLLPLGRYLLPLTTLNRYQTLDSSGKFFFTTTSRNAPIVRY